MSHDPMNEKFEQLGDKVKELWSRLSDSDVALARGRPEQFFVKLQEKYGLTKEEAQKRFEALKKSCGIGPDKAA